MVQGALSTAAVFCLQSWAITIKGPTYPSMFNPLALVFVAFAEAMILGEPLTVGTYEYFSFLPLIITIFISSLYCYVWLCMSPITESLGNMVWHHGNQLSSIKYVIMLWF